MCFIHVLYMDKYIIMYFMYMNELYCIHLTHCLTYAAQNFNRMNFIMKPLPLQVINLFCSGIATKNDSSCSWLCAVPCLKSPPRTQSISSL